MNGMIDNLNTISGKVIKILPLASGDSKNRPGEKWYRQEFVIETYAQYPRTVCLQIWGEDRIKSANLQLGEDVTITFELSSREFNEKWYTSVDARNIMKGMPQQMGGVPYGTTPQGASAPQQPFNPQMPGTNAPFGPQQGGNQDNNGGDDLPF